MACETPAVQCNNWVYSSPAEQQFLLIQLLNALGPSVSLTQLATDSAGYICQGSPAKLNNMAATLIAEQLSNVVTAQPVCYSPLELSAMQTYLVCYLLNQLS